MYREAGMVQKICVNVRCSRQGPGMYKTLLCRNSSPLILSSLLDSTFQKPNREILCSHCVCAFKTQGFHQYGGGCFAQEVSGVCMLVSRTWQAGCVRYSFHQSEDLDSSWPPKVFASAKWTSDYAHVSAISRENKKIIRFWPVGCGSVLVAWLYAWSDIYSPDLQFF
jgi:hypothetical protein